MELVLVPLEANSQRRVFHSWALCLSSSSQPVKSAESCLLAKMLLTSRTWIIIQLNIEMELQQLMNCCCCCCSQITFFTSCLIIVFWNFIKQRMLIIFFYFQSSSPPWSHFFSLFFLFFLSNGCLIVFTLETDKKYCKNPFWRKQKAVLMYCWLHLFDVWVPNSSHSWDPPLNGFFNNVKERSILLLHSGMYWAMMSRVLIGPCKNCLWGPSTNGMKKDILGFWKVWKEGGGVGVDGLSFLFDPNSGRNIVQRWPTWWNFTRGVHDRLLINDG